MNFIGSGDTFALYPDAQRWFLADDGVVESRSDSEAPIDYLRNLTTKSSGARTPSLGIDRARRERFHTSPVTVKSGVLLTTVML